MKKSVLLTIGLLLGGISVKAQTIVYQPIHGNYTQYVYHHQHWNGSENVESYGKTIWSGDTIINGESYTRMFGGGVSYYGGIREDVGTQQRYFIDSYNVEHNITISPFLSVGTILTDSSVYLNAFRAYTFINSDPNYDTLMITHVDSILETNGNYSATYRMECLPLPNVYFEYNTYRGLLIVNGFEFNESQYCYREDGEQTPPGQETPWTYMCDLGMDENSLLQIGLFPNPASEVLNLTGDLAMITDLTLYDISGTMMKQIPVSDIYSGISLKELKNGIYFVSVNENKKMLRFQKL